MMFFGLNFRWQWYGCKTYVGSPIAELLAAEHQYMPPVGGLYPDDPLKVEARAGN